MWNRVKTIPVIISLLCMLCQHAYGTTSDNTKYMFRITTTTTTVVAAAAATAVAVAVVVVVIIIIIWVLFILDSINPEYRSGSSLTALLSVPLNAFLSEGCVSVRPIAWKTRAEGYHFSPGFLRATSYGVEFLDFLQTTILRTSL